MIGRRLPAGRYGSHVRRQPARRSSPRLRSVQLLAGFLMAACLAGIFAVSVAPAFAARTLEIRGATFTSQSIIRSIVGMDGTPNIFRMQTDRAAQELVQLPAVESASVEVRLPSTVVVTVVERVPKLVWVIGDNRYVVDQDGLLFGLVDSAGNPIPSSAGPLPSPTEEAASSPSAEESSSLSPAPAATPKPTPTPKRTATPKPTATPKKPPAKATPTKPGTKGSPAPSAVASATPSPSPTPTINASLVPSLVPAPTADPAATSGPGALALPVVFDRMASDAGLGLGGVVDPVDLDAGFRLAGLTPTDVGSSAPGLAVVVDDSYGFTVSSVPAGWVAEFGFYTPTVRKDTVIPEQVRDLRSLLLKLGESHVAWVTLVADISDNHVNTYISR